MIPDNFSVTDSTSSATSSIMDSKNFINQDEFMKLFVEQLKHQDPLNPMDSYEMAAQLAQYSSLEQLVNINKNFEKFSEINSLNSFFQGINLVGKEVNYVGDKIYFDPQSNPDGMDIKFSLDETAEDLTLNIYDENDKLVKSISVPGLEKGENKIHWDGKNFANQDVTKGTYRYEIIGYNSDGDIISFTPYGNGLVESLRFDKDSASTLVKVNGDEIAITDIFALQ